MTIQTTALVPNNSSLSLASPLGIASDIVDVINPLQHIPFVSEIYRAATGDTISTGAQIVGGGLFGGIAGAAISAVSAAVEGMAGGEGAILQKAEAMMKSSADKTGGQSGAVPPNAAPLVSDQGEALVSMITDGTFDHDPRVAAPTPVASAASTHIPHLHDFREARPLGISGGAIEPQMKAALAAQANKIFS